MTKVKVNSGICGFTTTVTVEKIGNKKVRISLDSQCEMVSKMTADIPVLDLMAAFTNHLNNPVYKAAAKNLKHVACPVPAGILKAVEVELGLCLPKDAAIIFLRE